MARTGRPKVEKITVPCAGCGEPQLRYPSDMARNSTGRVLCGRCRTKGSGVGPKPRRGEERTCKRPGCGNAFYAGPNEPKRFCSRTCAASQWVVGRVAHICPTCGDEFLARAIETRKYCSAKCAGVEAVEIATIECEWCGTEFQWRSSEPRRFCTKPCFYKHQTANAQGSVNEHGYRMVSRNGVLIAEHRLVMSEILGRDLLPGENVHHRTGGRQGRSNNDPSNLELWVTSQPSGHRVEDVVGYCLMMLARYAPERLRPESVSAG